jgi:hypothetical protein
MDFCESRGLKYVLGLTPNPSLKALAKPWIQEAERLSRRRPVRFYEEIMHRAQSWTVSRRVIVKAEYTALGPNTRFIVTNLEGQDPRFLYKTAYCSRGEMELFIKGHKTHLHSDRTSCRRFTANHFRLLLTSLAYVLIETLRRRHLQGTSWATAQIDTIQRAVLKLGARVRELRYQIKVHLPSSYPWAAAWTMIWETLT